jgi:ABC-2 type transport system ATP-binding protein
MPEPVIKVENLGIRFVRTRRRKMKLRHVLTNSRSRYPRKGTFWALRDVSFSIYPGEAVGVIGPNGTGKSTLLKCISGGLIPDEGKVTVNDRSALLSLRAGFVNDLTGRENVFFAGALQGMTQAQMAERFDEIVRIAEAEEYIDSPVRHYSSGMLLRLGFAVATQLDHPILLVDEALAVGDKRFKKKSYKLIEKMLANGRTLLLVSHNERELVRFCDRGLYMEDGRLKVDGSLDEALAAYASENGDDGEASGE